MNKKGLKIDIGSGENGQPGYKSIDKRKSANPDILCEIGVEAIPLPDNSVSEVWSHNSFEHFPNFVFVVEDLARISQNGCIWLITLPYATTYLYNVINPYHVNPFFTEHTFRFWDDIYKREQPGWFTLKVQKTKFTYNHDLYGLDQDWDRLRKTNINVVKEFYQEIKVIK